MKPLNPPGDPLAITESKTDDDKDQFTITLQEKLKTDSTYQIEIKFEGQLGSDLHGLYKTSYYSDDGMQKWIALTHFNPFYARRAFPCFDEPYFKTEFLISIGRSNKYKSLFSMSLETTEPM